jgi:hypothetical protein
MPKTDTPLSSAQVAEILGCDVRTVNRRAGAGDIPYLLKMPGKTGAYVFLAGDIERIRKRAA